MPATPTNLLSVEDAAERLGVEVRFIRRIVQERRIGHVKVGKFVRFAEADLDAFIEAGRRKPVEK